MMCYKDAKASEETDSVLKQAGKRSRAKTPTINATA